MTIKDSPLYEKWKYKFDVWGKNKDFIPMRLIKTKDFAEGQNRCEAHLFELVKHYALVIEEGCCCYKPEEAKVDIFFQLYDANNLFKKWEKKHMKKKEKELKNYE